MRNPLIDMMMEMFDDDGNVSSSGMMNLATLPGNIEKSMTAVNEAVEENRGRGCVVVMGESDSEGEAGGSGGS